MHQKRQYLNFLSDVTLGKTVGEIFQLPRTLQIEISQCSTLKKNFSHIIMVSSFQKNLKKKEKRNPKSNSWIESLSLET